MSRLRLLSLSSSALFAALGLSFIVTTAYFVWTLYIKPDPLVTETQSGFSPPVVGYIAFYYLLHFGLVSALVVLTLLGIAGLVIGYILFRRLR